MSRPAIRHVERGLRHETGERSLGVEFAGLSYLAAWGMGGVTPRPASGQVGEGAGVALELPPIQLPPGVPRKVEAVLRYSDENGEAPPGYVDGRVCSNDGRQGEQVLPRVDADGDPIVYQEWDDNLSPEGPWLHQLVVSESDLCDLAVRLDGPSHPGVTCRTVRGSKARSTQGLFDEFAAALQFPCYFGENWNAFDECLADLEWLPGDAHILIISNAVHVLEDEPPGSFVDFLELVERVARERSEARPDDAGGQGPKPFHVVLHAEPTDGPALERKLEAAGVPYDLLH